jgi:hypothetical protein
MLPLGFEPTIPAFERAKTGHALDSAATVIGISEFYMLIKLYILFSCRKGRLTVNNKSERE